MLGKPLIMLWFFFAILLAGAAILRTVLCRLLDITLNTPQRICLWSKANRAQDSSP